MPFSTPITFVALDPLTAAQLNAMQGNIAELWPYTAQGDVSYASSATALEKLAKGTAGQVLTMNSGATAPEWNSIASKDFCQLGTDAAQNIAASSFETTVTWNIEDFDTLGWHESITHPDRITPNIAGNYQVMCDLRAASATAGELIGCLIYKFTVALSGVVIGGSSNVASGRAGLAVSKIVAMNGTDDYFFVNDFKSTSGTKALDVASCWITVRRI